MAFGHKSGRPIGHFCFLLLLIDMCAGARKPWVTEKFGKPVGFNM